MQNVEKYCKNIVELQKASLFVNVEFWVKCYCRMQKFYLKAYRNVDYNGIFKGNCNF